MNKLSRLAALLLTLLMLLSCAASAETGSDGIAIEDLDTATYQLLLSEAAETSEEGAGEETYPEPLVQCTDSIYGKECLLDELRTMTAEERCAAVNAKESYYYSHYRTYHEETELLCECDFPMPAPGAEGHIFDNCPWHPDNYVPEVDTDLGDIETDGICVTGDIPAGTEISVTTPDMADIDVFEQGLKGMMNAYTAIDVTLTDASGEEWQPESGKTLSVTMDVSGIGKAGDRVNVYHVHGEPGAQTLQIIEAGTIGADGNVSFSVNNFSYLLAVNMSVDGGTVSAPAEPIVPDLPAQPALGNGVYTYASAGSADLSSGAATIDLPKSGKATLSVAESGGQWQVLVGEQWVDVNGETGATFEVTYAKIAMLGSSAQIRWISADGETTSETATINVVEPVQTADEEDAMYYAASSLNVMPLADEVKPTYNVVVNYLFENGTVADSPYGASLAAGSNFSTTIIFPEVVGYLPYLGNATESTTSLDISITNIQADQIYTVYYKPTNVKYTVLHYQQNVDDDGYTLYATEELKGLTNSIVATTTDTYSNPELAKSYPGFTALLYEKAAIAADGSTVVEIYYDRNYYLMNFDLEGGYGVDPVYTRYGAAIGTVGTPTREGYVFNGWGLTADATEFVEIPANMPDANTTYYAVWGLGQTSYVVEYYLQDPNDATKYNFIAYREVNDVTTESVVDGVDHQNFDDLDGIELDQYEEQYSFFDHADEDVVVAGDGSTIVKVYYNRKDFTLKFYYAMSSGNTYYVVGGSTYYFGTFANENARDDEIDLLDQYNDPSAMAHTQRGVVTSTPSLNSAAIQSGKYTTGYDTSTVNETAYKYHYIQFTAKYGADLTDLWPSDVFDPVQTNGNSAAGNWNGETAYVSAWNGEHHVYYTQENGNQTIKGKYSKLDYQILWAAQYGEPDDSTVSYLCFWENGADISWSVPELYVYSIYVPLLEGQDTTGLTTRTYNGVTYYLRDQYNTVDDSDVDNQTQPAIEGFVQNGYDHAQINNPDSDKYSEAYEMYFYYSRQSYDLTFFSDGKQVKTESMPYEEPFANHTYTPPYPSSLEKDAYTFEGWYLSPNFTEGTKVDFTTETMPAYPVALYARWIPVNRTVNFYLTEEAMNTSGATPLTTATVSHGSLIDQDKVPSNLTNGGLTFVGWFYVNEDGEETAINFESMEVRGDMNVYAKWSSNVSKKYVIMFKVKGGTNDGTEIADRIVGSTLAGNTKTFDAKGDDELYATYQEGYFPEVASHSLTLEANTPTSAGTDANGNEWYEITNADGSTEIVQGFTFWYVQKDTVPYTVKYINTATGTNVFEVDGEEKTIPDKVVSNNTKAVVTETYVQIKGYLPDAYQKRLVVSVDSANNVITFYYTKDDAHAYYTITHYIEPAAGQEWQVYSSSEAIGNIGKEYSAESISIDGFTYDSTVEGTLTMGTLTADGLELKLYYVRNTYPYKVRYLEQGTNKVLLTEQSGTAKFGATVSANAPSIDGYTLVSATPQSLVIQIEDVDESGNFVVDTNIITFYYTEQEATINYVVVGPDGCGTVSPTSETVKVVTGVASGSTAEASSTDYKFVGWYSDEACTQQVSTEAKYVPTQPGRTTAEDGTVTNGLWPETTVYYAKFEWNVTSLTIKKDISNPVTGETPTFIFKVTGDNLPTDGLLVTIQGDGSVKIDNLTVGSTYTVTEIDSWSWRYTDVAGEDAEHEWTLVANPDNDPDVNVITVTNKRDNDKWLDGETSAENAFTGIVTE